ncbi:hypothetical protein D1872_298580 [compost metagenome]
MCLVHVISRRNVLEHAAQEIRAFRFAFQIDAWTTAQLHNERKHFFVPGVAHRSGFRAKRMVFVRAEKGQAIFDEFVFCHG